MTDSLESYCIFWTFSGLCAQFCSLQSICLSSEGEKGHKWGLSSGTPITASDIWTCNHSSTSSLTDLTHFIRVPEESKGGCFPGEGCLSGKVMPGNQCVHYQFEVNQEKIGWPPKLRKVPPRFELGSLDSKSRVLTITPWGHYNLVPAERFLNIHWRACGSIQDFVNCNFYFKCIYIKNQLYPSQQRIQEKCNHQGSQALWISQDPVHIKNWWNSDPELRSGV